MKGVRQTPAKRPDLTFPYYVQRGRVMPSIYGPLLASFRADAQLPAFETWAQLETYLQAKGKADLDIALRLWRCYQAWFRDRQRLKELRR
ncbi:hypothetical protein [Luteibacter yeojuensis]|uniref:Uncharacterized protein n=1 Tax=Luteibacter yeojuensis TaxID=345309 RepID=A0A0F3KJY0_9GAMM|nr:hypothetical protein [Luteibacter yeojuensis]KJV31287.1 hypothetical protein VI08_13585 [Luteibacter yeojuensis]